MYKIFYLVHISFNSITFVATFFTNVSLYSIKIIVGLYFKKGKWSTSTLFVIIHLNWYLPNDKFKNVVFPFPFLPIKPNFQSVYILKSNPIKI